MRERIAQFQVAAVLAAFVTLTASSRAASQELARAQKPASLDSAAIDEASARMFMRYRASDAFMPGWTSR